MSYWRASVQKDWVWKPDTDPGKREWHFRWLCFEFSWWK